MPQLLARADNVKDFIRRGEDEGSVTIHLASGEPRPVVIYRRIRFDAQTGGVSDWKLNGVFSQQSQACCAAMPLPPGIWCSSVLQCRGDMRHERCQGKDEGAQCPARQSLPGADC